MWVIKQGRKQFLAGLFRDVRKKIGEAFHSENSRRFLPVFDQYWICYVCSFFSISAWGIPEEFVYLDEAIPGIRIDLKYAGEDNFMGRPVIGYVSQRTVLTKPAAEALRGVQSDLKAFGLELLVFDTYRPQQAVDDFVAWPKDLSETRTRAKYYPNLGKEALFAEGYIAEKSGHTRGSMVDLTLVQSLQFGTGPTLRILRRPKAKRGWVFIDRVCELRAR